MQDSKLSVNALESKIGKSMDGLTPGADSHAEVEVKVNTNNSIFGTLIDDFMAAATTISSMQGGSIPVSEDELKDYLRFTVQARVLNLTQQKCIWKRHDSYAVPSFMAVLLAQIGYIDNSDLGISMVPGLDEEVVDIDLSTIKKVSMFLMSLEKVGFEMMQGLPRHSKGSWEMMSMEVVDGVVRNSTYDHSPVYAVCAAFLGTTGIANVLGANAFRIKYLETSQAKAFSYDLVAPKSS